MLCTSGDQSLSFAHFESRARRGRLARTGNGVPFDAASDGLVPGEGRASWCSSGLADAKRDGDNILRSCRVGTAWDDSVEPGTSGLPRERWRGPASRAADVAAVEAAARGSAHRTSPSCGRSTRPIRLADRVEPVQVSAAAFQFGHLGGGSGSSSHSSEAIEEVDRAEMLPVAGLTVPADFARDTSGRQLAVARGLRSPQHHADGRLFAAVNSISQGQAWHAIIERPTKVAAPVRTTPSSSATIYRVSALVGGGSFEAAYDCPGGRRVPSARSSPRPIMSARRSSHRTWRGRPVAASGRLQRESKPITRTNCSSSA